MFNMTEYEEQEMLKIEDLMISVDELVLFRLEHIIKEFCPKCQKKLNKMMEE